MHSVVNMLSSQDTIANEAKININQKIFLESHSHRPLCGCCFFYIFKFGSVFSPRRRDWFMEFHSFTFRIGMFFSPVILICELVPGRVKMNHSAKYCRTVLKLPKHTADRLHYADHKVGGAVYCRIQRASRRSRICETQVRQSLGRTSASLPCIDQTRRRRVRRTAGEPAIYTSNTDSHRL